MGFPNSLICFCNTSEINGIKSPLHSSCFQKELSKKLLYYLLILYKVRGQNLTVFYRQKFNPSEKSIVHFVAASHTSSQTIPDLQPECNFPPVVSHHSL